MSGPISTTTLSSPAPAGYFEAQARSRVYAFLSRAFLYPDADTTRYLRENATEVVRCLQALSALRTPILRSEGVEPGLASWKDDLWGDLEAAYLSAFGHTTSKECPPYEAEYGQADVFQKSEALADIGGFYRAFGVEPRLLDRLDHLSVELEFMHFLALKEAYALARQHLGERLALCQEAQARFLEGHLGQWVGSFALRLAAKVGTTAYGTLAELVACFVAWDMARCGLTPPPPLALSIGDPDESGRVLPHPNPLPLGEGRVRAPSPACEPCPGPAMMGGVKDE